LKARVSRRQIDQIRDPMAGGKPITEIRRSKLCGAESECRITSSAADQGVRQGKPQAAISPNFGAEAQDQLDVAQFVAKAGDHCPSDIGIFLGQA